MPAGQSNPDLRRAPLVLLDDSRAGHLSRRSLLFDRPEYLIIAQDFSSLPKAFAAMDQAYRDGLHLAGWIAYECAHFFEPRLRHHLRQSPKEPLIWMMATRHRNELNGRDVQEALHGAARGNARSAHLDIGQSVVDKNQYLDDLDQIHRLIRAGDVYQINHTFPLPCQLSGDPLALYERLRTSQPVPYGGYINTGDSAGDFHILSLSPELFLERRGERLMSRPMKGTAPRGKTLAEDEATMATLASDTKSRAENLMIVDLIRNDLSRISKPGSVKVNNLFEVERYKSLHQMTSSVQGQANEDLTPSKLLAAMFPCGSVTGAPKVRAMEIISSLETAPRGVYCGTIGHFSPPQGNRSADWALNVPIRTLILDESGAGRLSVGSGVVADSNPQGEYEECLLKARFAKIADVDPFALIETIRLSEDGCFNQLDLHLARLQDSATYFDFSYKEQTIRASLAQHALVLAPLDGPQRIRLLLAEDGAVAITSAPLAPASSNTATVCLSAEPVSSDDTFLFHKTTRRTLYDTAHIKAQASGFDDLLFFNERDELTEGAISNVFVVKDGCWITPPLSAGLLPGILRQTLLASSEHSVEEDTILREDLLDADEIYIGNSLRGLRRAILSPVYL